MSHIVRLYALFYFCSSWCDIMTNRSIFFLFVFSSCLGWRHRWWVAFKTTFVCGRYTWEISLIPLDNHSCTLHPISFRTLSHHIPFVWKRSSSSWKTDTLCNRRVEVVLSFIRWRQWSADILTKIPNLRSLSLKLSSNKKIVPIKWILTNISPI